MGSRLDRLLPSGQDPGVEFELIESVPANVVHVTASGRRFQHELGKVVRRYGEGRDLISCPSVVSSTGREIPPCAEIGRHLKGNVLTTPGVLLSDSALLGRVLSVKERRTQASVSVEDTALCEVHLQDPDPPGCPLVPKRPCLPRWCIGTVGESFEVWVLQRPE